MTSEYTHPILNISAVVRETGIKADTIRAWERRYGLPEPARSEGGHRVYSQRDVDILKWLRARKREGLSISRAVDRWKSLLADGQDPLDAAAVRPAGIGAAVAGSSLEAIRRGWLESATSFNEAGANDLLDQAFAQYAPETVLIEVLQKGLSGVGEGWFESYFSVQQEHFVSELAIRRLEALLSAAPHPTLQDAVLIACAPGERHTFPGLALAYLLRRRGLDVLYLGADVPLQRLEEALTRTQPALGVLSAQRLPSAANLRDAAALINSAQVPVAYGGWIFNQVPALREIVPGRFLGEDLIQAAATIFRLLRSAPAPSIAPSSEGIYLDLIGQVERLRPRIEDLLLESLREETMNELEPWLDHLDLAPSILAALRLEHLDALSHHLEWAFSLGANHSIPRASMESYLEGYREAMLEVLDGSRLASVPELARRLKEYPGG